MLNRQTILAGVAGSLRQRTLDRKGWFKLLLAEQRPVPAPRTSSRAPRIHPIADS